MREISVAGQRYKAVLAVIGDGRTVTEVAASWEVSRQTLHSRLARYADGGLERWRTARTGRGRARTRWTAPARSPVGESLWRSFLDRHVPSTTAKVTFSRAAPGRWRRESGRAGEPLPPRPARSALDRHRPRSPSGDQHLGTPQRRRPPGYQGRAEPRQRHQRHHDHRRPSGPRTTQDPGLSRLTLCPRILAIRGLRGLHVVVERRVGRAHTVRASRHRVGQFSGTCRTHDGDGWDLTRGFA